MTSTGDGDQNVGVMRADGSEIRPIVSRPHDGNTVDWGRLRR